MPCVGYAIANGWRWGWYLRVRSLVVEGVWKGAVTGLDADRIGAFAPAVSVPDSAIRHVESGLFRVLGVPVAALPSAWADWAAVVAVGATGVMVVIVARYLTLRWVGRVSGLSYDWIALLRAERAGKEAGAHEHLKRCLAAALLCSPVIGVIAGAAGWELSAERHHMIGFSRFVGDAFVPNWVGVFVCAICLLVFQTVYWLFATALCCSQVARRWPLDEYRRCTKCGYSLVGLCAGPNVPQCPECGHKEFTATGYEKTGVARALTALLAAARSSRMVRFCGFATGVCAVSWVIISVVFAEGSIRAAWNPTAEALVYVRDWLTFRDSRISWSWPEPPGTPFLLMRDDVPYVLETEDGEFAVLTSVAAAGTAGRRVVWKHAFSAMHMQKNGAARFSAPLPGMWKDETGAGKHTKLATVAHADGTEVSVCFTPFCPGMKHYRLFANKPILGLRPLNDIADREGLIEQRLRASLQEQLHSPQNRPMY